MRWYRKGQTVTAQRDIDGMNRPHVPKGSLGTIVATTLIGRPKGVQFALLTEWGPKQFRVEVRRGDVK